PKTDVKPEPPQKPQKARGDVLEQKTDILPSKEKVVKSEPIKEPLVEDPKNFKTEEDYVKAQPKYKLGLDDERNYREAIKNYRDGFYPNPEADFFDKPGHFEYGNPLPDKTYKWLDSYTRGTVKNAPSSIIQDDLTWFIPKEPVILYRGIPATGDSVSNVGFRSWTYNKKVAEGFAGKDGRVIMQVIEPKDILFDSTKAPAAIWSDLMNPEEMEVIVKNIKTKSQLTDIWKKSQKTTIPKSKVAKLAKEEKASNIVIDKAKENAEKKVLPKLKKESLPPTKIPETTKPPIKKNEVFSKKDKDELSYLIHDKLHLVSGPNEKIKSLEKAVNYYTEKSNVDLYRGVSNKKIKSIIEKGELDELYVSFSEDFNVAKGFGKNILKLKKGNEGFNFYKNQLDELNSLKKRNRKSFDEADGDFLINSLNEEKEWILKNGKIKILSKKIKGKNTIYEIEFLNNKTVENKVFTNLPKRDIIKKDLKESAVVGITNFAGDRKPEILKLVNEGKVDEALEIGRKVINDTFSDIKEIKFIRFNNTEGGFFPEAPKTIKALKAGQEPAFDISISYPKNKRKDILSRLAYISKESGFDQDNVLYSVITNKKNIKAEPGTIITFSKKLTNTEKREVIGLAAKNGLAGHTIIDNGNGIRFINVSDWGGNKADFVSNAKKFAKSLYDTGKYNIKNVKNINVENIILGRDNYEQYAKQYDTRRSKQSIRTRSGGPSRRGNGGSDVSNKTSKINLPKNKTKHKPVKKSADLRKKLNEKSVLPKPKKSDIIKAKETPKTKIIPKASEVKAKKEKEEFTSKVFERMQAENPELLKGDLKATKVHLDNESKKAIEIMERDKQTAYNLAMGREESSDVLGTSVNIAMTEKALEEGNNKLAAKLIKNRSLAQTRRGQELVAEKGSITDNSASRYMKELLSNRLDKLGDKYTDGIKDILKKGSKKENAINKIEKEIANVEIAITNKKLDTKTALALLDKMTCI
ncbi:MAG: hypothetical protein PHS54_05905, partial [Clostridia bacterium]|nr:hypothetical protein [Clostridia bacterium]